MRARAAFLVAVLTIVTALLHRIGDGPLATPPLSSWSQASAWYERSGPPLAAMSGLRVVALGLAVWLLLAAILQLLASLSPGVGLIHLADHVAPRALRHLVRGAVGVSLSAAVALPLPPAAAQGPPTPPPDAVAVMRPLPDVPASTTPAPTPDDGATATMRPLPAEAPAVPAPLPLEAPALPAPPVVAPSADAPPVAPADEVVTVEAGDSFWSLATSAVVEALGRRASEAEVRRYWLVLIDANRDRLEVPGNPDLLRPDQELVQPPVATS